MSEGVSPKGVLSGVDALIPSLPDRLDNRKVALLANPASVTSEFIHTYRALISAEVDLVSLFGPQHGFAGQTQANMIEWDGYTHPSIGIPVFSLYGESRKPDKSMLEGIDTFIIDLQDTGARPYTYLWTATLAMEACAEVGVEVLILDRPNPIGGETTEGPILTPDHTSFVGLFPLPMRHGLTIAEALIYIDESKGIGCHPNVILMEGWKRNMYYNDTLLPWVMPSPNIPTIDSAMVYPGTVMLEGTNISEGRGTTRPFEIIGAPWIDSEALAIELSHTGLRGATFRPLLFRPTWDKYSGQLCGGIQIHITDRKKFCPVRCGAAIIGTVARCYPEYFNWISPPYEYEYQKLPIDIISGSPDLRITIDSNRSLTNLFDIWDREASEFLGKREKYLLY